MPSPAPSLSLPGFLQAPVGRMKALTATLPEGTTAIWLLPPELATIADYESVDAQTLIVVPQVENAAASVGAVALYQGKLLGPVWCKIQTGTTPVPPVPPGPGPLPPVPPAPVPIPGEGLRVLMVYKSADLSGYSAGQKAALYAGAVRDYLIGHCAKGADGKTPDFRIYDQDAVTKDDAKVWQDAMKRPRQATPWIIVSNGKAGFEGPLPQSAADTLTLLQKFGGP